MIMKKKNPSMIFIIFLFFFFVLPSPSLSSSSARCNPQDKKVLLTIKKSLGNPYHLASWNPKDSDCCTWYCLQCDPNTGRVIELTIFQGNISGQIPPAVGDLPYLQTLVFRHLTNLTGTIPESITKLTRLKMLRLSWTNLSGPIPPFLSQLKNLEYLDLSFNDLTGSIPPSLSQLPNLGALHLDRNKLTGSIPDSFGNFKGTDFYLYLSHNQLTGNVPKSLGNLLTLSYLDLSRNKLEGDISFLFGIGGAGNKIEVADFSRNLFEFDLSNLVFSPNNSLRSLDLNHNKIYGSIPKGLASLDNLQFLNVSYNRLCGQIPVGGRLQSFETTEYFHNKCLCGAPLPPCK